MVPFEGLLKHRDVAELRVHDKLARQCSYMHSKTFVAQVEALTGRKFDWFKLPPNVILRPVGVGEIRVILPSGEAAVCIEETGDVVHIAMPSLMVNHPFPCLTSLTDRSGILSSLLHHLAHVGFLVPFFFGFVHALFNDMKLSARHSSGGRSWNSVTSLLPVYNMNYGPFGSGVWFTTKVEHLKQFMASHSWGHPKFQAVVEDFGRSMRMPFRTELDQQNLFTAMADMASLNEKGPTMKLSRWGSIHESH